MMKYTIVMPMFNASMLIEKNLKKFKKLNRNDVEIIIIDDGSSDESAKIVKQYQNQINNLILIEQENKGVSYSRNVGIEKATGKYLAFLDCDDSLEMELFDKIDSLYQEDYDLIRYGIKVISKKKMKKEKIVDEEQVYDNFNKSNDRYQLTYTTNKMNPAWNQMIKTEILKEKHIFFCVQHKYAEDFEFNRQLVQYVEKVCFLPECFYHYYINENGISRTEKRENVMKCIRDSIEIHTRTYLECKETKQELIEDTFKNISLEFMTTLRRIFFIDSIKNKEIGKLFNQLRTLENIVFLQNEKKLYHWKSNVFIDNCLYGEPNYLKIVLFKNYFKLKKIAKDIIS